MRIRTITCHDCYNYGASLQAYALQHYLESIGHEVEIIDYKPWYLDGHYKLWSVGNPRYHKPLLWQLYNMAKLPGRILAYPHKKTFDRFTAKYLHLTRRYSSYNELKANPPEADAYIAGSDQIWNTLFQNGRDASFYLDFGSSKVKRISYAASFATPDIVAEYKNFVREELKNFDYISIRERKSLKLLKSLGVTTGVTVCDPVFLINKNEWTNFAHSVNCIGQKYLLVYLTDKSGVIKNIALEIKKYTGWKIFAIGCHSDWADKNFTYADPVEFVSFINGSEFVISNSFHATAFSIILNKKFCVTKRIESINERMISLLSDYGLTDRLTDKFFPAILENLNFETINQTTDKIVRNSKLWLNKVLSI